MAIEYAADVAADPPQQRLRLLDEEIFSARQYMSVWDGRDAASALDAVFMLRVIPAVDAA